MGSVKIYVEGGVGDSEALRTACRRGFSQFLEKAGLAGKMPRVVPCGSRHEAYHSFCTALRQNKKDELPLLLVDSEVEVAPHHGPWPHLHHHDQWQKPAQATEDQAHLMVQCMETWLVADVETLVAYFKQGFNRNPLPRNQDLESVAKADILKALANATRPLKKNAYDKGQHSFALLALIDPDQVRQHCSHADRFIAFLLNRP
ncbi:MAG: DUF4276 family protein [Chloroflexi bacterium]|nr:DUF4276 family protein [Chloroflexota bacterium]